MEKVKSIIYAAGMTTVATIALFCTVKFGLLVHKTEKLVNKLDEQNIIKNVGDITDDSKELIGDAKEIVGELKKEFKTPDSPDNDNGDDKIDDKSDNKKSDESKALTVSNKVSNKEVANEIKKAVRGGAKAVNNVSTAVGYAVILLIMRLIWWIFTR